MTSKGQITLRKEPLRHPGVPPGGKISIETLPGGEIKLRVAQAMGKISDVSGMLKREGQRPLSIDDMNAVTAERWVGEP